MDVLKHSELKQEKLSAEDKKRIGVLLDDSGFCSQLSVNDIEHILAKMYPRFNKDFFERKCLEYRFPMNKKIAEFSSGMKVRLKITYFDNTIMQNC